MIGHAERHDCHRSDATITGILSPISQILNSPFQVRAVIQSGTQHHLAVQRDSCLRQALDLLIKPSYSGIPSNCARNSGSVACTEM